MDAINYMRAHHLEENDLPHMAVIDSRTGAKIVTMKGETKAMSQMRKFQLKMMHSTLIAIITLLRETKLQYYSHFLFMKKKTYF